MKLCLFLNIVQNTLLSSADQNQVDSTFDFMNSYFIKNLYWQKVVYYLIVAKFFYLYKISDDPTFILIYLIMQIVNFSVIFIDIFLFNLTVPIAICTYLYLIIVSVIGLAALSFDFYEKTTRRERERRENQRF